MFLPALPCLRRLKQAMVVVLPEGFRSLKRTLARLDPDEKLTISVIYPCFPWFSFDALGLFYESRLANIYGELFASDLEELKAIGGTTSSIRTPEQTNIAKFVTDNPVAQYHRLARLVAEAVPSDLEMTARAFAHVSLALADAFISSFDGKFTYHFWR